MAGRGPCMARSASIYTADVRAWRARQPLLWGLAPPTWGRGSAPSRGGYGRRAAIMWPPAASGKGPPCGHCSLYMVACQYCCMDPILTPCPAAVLLMMLMTVCDMLMLLSGVSLRGHGLTWDSRSVGCHECITASHSTRCQQHGHSGSSHSHTPWSAHIA